MRTVIPFPRARIRSTERVVQFCKKVNGFGFRGTLVVSPGALFDLVFSNTNAFSRPSNFVYASFAWLPTISTGEQCPRNIDNVARTTFTRTNVKIVSPKRRRLVANEKPTYSFSFVRTKFELPTPRVKLETGRAYDITDVLRDLSVSNGTATGRPGITIPTTNEYSRFRVITVP